MFTYLAIITTIWAVGLKEISFEHQNMDLNSQILIEIYNAIYDAIDLQPGAFPLGVVMVVNCSIEHIFTYKVTKSDYSC